MNAADAIIPGFQGELTINAILAPYTSWRLGGPADLLALPRDRHDLLNACGYARERGLPLTILGNGTNVLISDAGLRGLVLVLRRNVAELTVDSDTGEIQAEAGTMLPAISVAAARAGWAGFEFLCDIPGTIGGAVAGNAGTGGINGPSIQTVLATAQVWDPQAGNVRRLEHSALGFAYRRSRVYADQLVVLSAVLRATHRDDPAAISTRQREIIAQRKAKQPPERLTAGSVFRLSADHDHEQRTPGWFIEHSGLKGAHVGGAFISPVHANWIVNDGTAKSTDVLALMRHVVQQVQERYGVLLEPEVHLLGLANEFMD